MMLLDTCVLFWLEQAPEEISASVSAELSRLDIPVFASAISVTLATPDPTIRAYPNLKTLW